MEKLELWCKRWEHPQYEFCGFVEPSNQDFIMDTLDPDIIKEAIMVKRLENGLIEGVNYRDFSEHRKVR